MKVSTKVSSMGPTQNILTIKKKKSIMLLARIPARTRSVSCFLIIALFWRCIMFDLGSIRFVNGF